MSNEYEIKTKVEQEQLLQLKILLLLGYTLSCCLGGDQLLVGEIKFGGGSLLGGMSKFSAGRGGTPPPFPPVRKILNSWEWGLRLEFPEVSQK